MNNITINKQRYEKLIKDYEKYISEAEAWIAKMKMFLWEFRMLIEKDKGEEENKNEYNS